jgi:hypothetical protein
VSYDYPNKKYPTAADVDAMASLLALRQSDQAVGGGTGGITGTPTVPNLAISTTSLAYFKATADVMMFRLGYISQNEAICTGSSTTFSNTGFQDFPNMPSAAFTIPAAGLYMVYLDLAGFWQASGTFGVQLRIANAETGLNGSSLSWNWYPSAISQRVPRFNACTPMRMADGTNTLRVQVKMLNAGETLGQDTSTVRAITVSS